MVNTKVKRGAPVLLLAIGLLAIGLAGCGISQEDYDAAVARADGLAADKTALETQVASLTAAKTTLEADNADLQSQVAALQSDKDGLQADKTALQADKTSLQTDKANLTADLADLQEQHDAATAALAAVNDVFPPRQFATLQELTAWLTGNSVSERLPSIYAEDWYQAGLDLQLDALQDGFIVSVDYDIFDDGTFGIWCTTVISGTIYYWDPETDDYFEETGLVDIQPGVTG